MFKPELYTKLKSKIVLMKDTAGELKVTFPVFNIDTGEKQSEITESVVISELQEQIQEFQDQINSISELIKDLEKFEMKGG